MTLCLKTHKLQKGLTFMREKVGILLYVIFQKFTLEKQNNLFALD